MNDQECIGVDDAFYAAYPRGVSDATRVARQFMQLYQQAYLLLHRRVDPSHHRPTMQSHAVLEHLAHAGPLTIGEMAQHLDRAQSVVSEIVDQLEGNGLVARVKDPGDRRRTLVWLTDEALALLERHRDVLDCDQLAACLAALAPDDREALIRSFGSLIASAETIQKK